MYLIVPGINGSGPDHWQTHWEKRDAHFKRVVQEDWDNPELNVWIKPLNAQVNAYPGSWIVAHSLGCLLIASQEFKGDVRGAFLVAPPNPRGPGFPNVARSFQKISDVKLAFRSVVVASENDPYSSLDFAKQCASTWGSEFVSVGSKGHINSASGLGFWDEGYQLFLEFIRQ